jgi:rSAM/selenodomain-associated transferase 1
MTDLIVYLKNPEPGKVKTRLQPHYSPEEAARLYRGFIEDTVETVSSIGADRCWAAYTPADSRSEIEAFIPSDWNLAPQVGDDLGSRMRQSLNASIASGADRAILIGSDTPSLPSSHITSALSRLENADVVLGPTYDGGFYLIGIRSTVPDIFSNVTWSTDNAFEQTAEGIRSKELMMSLIPPWNDIDTPEDLDAEIITSRKESRMTDTDRVYRRLSQSNP